MNPFQPNKGPIDHLKRNTYDLMYINNFTGNFGTLYPVFCKEVNPGDSLSIETVFGLRAQPMVFPIQTPIRADIHYFYVRNRTLWSNFMDFYGKTKDGLVHPYIDRPVTDFKTKSIYDFLGIPTTVMAGDEYGDLFSMNPYNMFGTQFTTGKDTVSLSVASLVNPGSFSDPLTKSNYRLGKVLNISSKALYFKNITNSMGTQPNVTFMAPLYQYNTPDPYNTCFISPQPTTVFSSPCFIGPHLSIDYFSTNDYTSFVNQLKSISFSFTSFSDKIDYNPSEDSTGDCFYVHWFCGKSSSLLDKPTQLYSLGMCAKYNGSSSLADRSYSYDSGAFSTSSVPSAFTTFSQANYEYFLFRGYDVIVPIFVVRKFTTNNEWTHMLYDNLYNGLWNVGGSCYVKGLISSGILDASEMNSLPWCGNDKKIFINALPYRGYEAIYNSFYRNQQINPFKLTANGQPEYNRYVTNLDDGSDSTPYKLYQRNYEYDFLTGAFHSPQQGTAPLVGLTVSNANSTATFKFSSPDINNGAEITATTRIDDSGQVIGITGYDPDLPQSNITRLMEAINYGISINDIRQTNGLQKWLEKNIRRGYRYKDQLASHFGVNVSFNELLMPEFIGGVSKPINVDTIYQTVTNENGVLGDYAGRAGVVGSSNHRVSKYCDEAGFIIGILSIVPTPVYSQVPAGYAFKHELLDYYFPEFSKIGMQPIFNKHVTPLQCSPTELNTVFGYQRPYWDLIRSVDEVHGEFRSTANGYVIQRMFAETPILNQNFLEINSKHLNDVFMITDTDVSDQFKGQIKFMCKRKTSIPLNAVPSIE